MTPGTFNDPVLFDERPLDNHLAGLRKVAVAAAKSLGRAELLTGEAVLDEAAVDDVVTAIVAVHRVEPVVFNFDQIRATPISEEDGLLATSIVVPFTGNADLLRLDANHQAPFSAELRGSVARDDDGSGHRLVFWVRSRTLETDLDALVAERTHQLESKISWTNKLVGQWNAELEQHVRGAASERGELLARMAATEASMTIPIVRTPEPAIALPVKRRELPEPRRTDVHGSAVTSESRSGRTDDARGGVLEDQIYEEVLRTLVLFASAAGRLPGSVGKLSENDMRNFALLVLNASYHLSAARGEVFNGKGKTDLLVPWDGGNAFVGEVKKFDGAQTVTAALSQLLTYVTWADTKAALIIIVERRDVTAALGEIDRAVQTHPRFLRSLPAEVPERRRDYVVGSNHDNLREVRMAVIPIVILDPDDIADPDN